MDLFLAQLEPSDAELLFDTAREALSPVEVWVLASILGYRGGFSDFVAWAQPLSERQDRIEILSKEAESLVSDLKTVREDIKYGRLDQEKGLGRVASFSKELRSHMTELDRLSKGTDRRALLMAGADCVLRELRGIFADNPEMRVALESASMAAWLQVGEQK
jgi:hypothetical protein